jgi:hypothetical protein
MKVNIRNQCSDFKLLNRKCFSDGADWKNDPAWSIDAGSMMSVDLEPLQPTFECALICKLQRKYREVNDQSELTCIRLLVVWKSEGYKKFRVLLQLIEYTKTFCWDEIQLREYCQRYASQLSAYTDPIKDTWLISDGTVLMTRLHLDFTQRDGALNITISEGAKDEYTKRPEWINPKT